MQKRRSRRLGEVGDQVGQDSFLDLVSNIVGILIILVMIAGVRAQNSPPPEVVETEESVEAVKKVEYVDKELLESLDGKYQEFRKKEVDALLARAEIDSMKKEMAVYDEQIEHQAAQHAELFDMMTSARAAIEIVAEEKDQATKEKIEQQRQIQEIEAKLQQLGRTKEWIAANRPKATVLENIPTPISKTVGENEKEAHFRLLGGRISYVPIPELMEAVMLEFAQNREKYGKQKMTDGKVGPIGDWTCEFLMVSYDAHVRGPYGGVVVPRIEMDLVEFLPVRELIGQPVKEALASPQSELITKLRYFRQDIYTITIWVYPDSFEEFREFKKVLHEQGYRVAARPLEFGESISGSPRGTKSSSQ